MLDRHSRARLCRVVIKRTLRVWGSTETYIAIRLGVTRYPRFKKKNDVGMDGWMDGWVGHFRLRYRMWMVL